MLADVSQFSFLAHYEGEAMRLAPRDEANLRVVRLNERHSPLEEVYRRYGRYVAAVIFRLEGRQAEVEDLVQDVFVEATRGIARLQEPEAIKGWLATIAVRVVRRHLRRRRLRAFLGRDAGADYSNLVDPSASPVDLMMLNAVYRVLDDIPTDERIAFSMHVIEGETVEGVARLCGCSYATAKRRIARAQRVIEERLGHG
jgi:RNA polymerase sigma-70 factor, ECF subfamily